MQVAAFILLLQTSGSVTGPVHLEGSGTAWTWTQAGLYGWIMLGKAALSYFPNETGYQGPV